MLIPSPEASRAKHKFAVKRNSWPKTRGVAMNPVDHVRVLFFERLTHTDEFLSLTVVVIISTLEKLRPYRDMRWQVKKRVSSLPGEPGYCGVPRKPRTRCCSDRRLDGSQYAVTQMTIPANARISLSRLSTELTCGNRALKALIPCTCLRGIGLCKLGRLVFRRARIQNEWTYPRPPKAIHGSI